MKFEFDENSVHKFCIENNIIKLSFFGSILTDKFDSESDVDILVEFETGCKPGYLGMARMQRELSGILGRKVDLRTKEELSRYFREEVIKEAVVKYG